MTTYALIECPQCHVRSIHEKDRRQITITCRHCQQTRLSRKVRSMTESESLAKLREARSRINAQQAGEDHPDESYFEQGSQIEWTPTIPDDWAPEYESKFEALAEAYDPVKKKRELFADLVDDQPFYADAYGEAVDSLLEDTNADIDSAEARFADAETGVRVAKIGKQTHIPTVWRVGPSVTELPRILEELLPALTDAVRTAAARIDESLLEGDRVGPFVDEVLVDEVGIVAGDGAFANALAKWALRYSDPALRHRFDADVDTVLDEHESFQEKRERLHDALTGYVAGQTMLPYGRDDLETATVAALGLLDYLDREPPELNVTLDGPAWEEMVDPRTGARFLDAVEVLAQASLITLETSPKCLNILSNQYRERVDEWVTAGRDRSRHSRGADAAKARRREVAQLLEEDVVGRKKRGVLLAMDGEEWTTMAALKAADGLEASSSSLRVWLAEDGVLVETGLVERGGRASNGAVRIRLTERGATACDVLNPMDLSVTHPDQMELELGVTHPPKSCVGTVYCTGQLSEGGRDGVGPQPQTAPLAAVGAPSIEEWLADTGAADVDGFVQWLGERNADHGRLTPFVQHEVCRLSSCNTGITFTDDLTRPFDDGRVTYLSYQEAKQDLQLVTQWGGSEATLIRLATALADDRVWGRILTRERLGQGLERIVTGAEEPREAIEQLSYRRQLGWPVAPDDEDGYDYHAWRDRLQTVARSLLEYLQDEEARNDPEQGSQEFRDAHGLFALLTQTCHAADIDVTTHIRLPDPSNILNDEARLGDFTSFFENTAPKHSAYVDHAAYRHTVEEREQKLKHRHSLPDDIERDSTAELTTDWVVQGPDATELQEHVAAAIGRVEPRDAVADGAEAAPLIEIPVVDGSSRDAIRGIVEDVLARKGWRSAEDDPDADLEKLVDTLVAMTCGAEPWRGSPAAAAEALFALTKRDAGEPITTRDLQIALGNLSPDRFLPGHPPTLGRMLQVLLCSKAPLTPAAVRELADVSISSWENNHGVLEGLGFVRRSEDGLVATLTPWWVDGDEDIRYTAAGDAIWPLPKTDTPREAAWALTLLLDQATVDFDDGIWDDGVWSKPPPGVDVDELLAIDAALARWLPVALSVGCAPPWGTDTEREQVVASVGYDPTARDNRQTALVGGVE